MALYLVNEGVLPIFESFSLRQEEQTPGCSFSYGCLWHFDESESEKPII